MSTNDRFEPEKHPKGAYILCGVEATERMAFYAMKAVLPFYMAVGLHLNDAQVSAYIGYYIGAVYATPAFASLLTARYLGHYWGAVVGGLMMLAGHGLATWESSRALYGALALVAVGSGFFKPAMMCMLRGLYPGAGSRYDAASGAYYVSINVGAGAAGVIAAYMSDHYGFSAAFATAGGGLFVGMLGLLAGRRYLEHAHVTPAQRASQLDDPADTEFVFMRVAAVCAVTVLGCAYWAAFYQDSYALPRWLDGSVNRHGMNPVLFTALNPVIIIGGTPVVNWLMRRYSLRLTTWMVMALGAASVAYLTLAASTFTTGRVSWLWFLAYTVVMTVGELLLSPQGNALVGTLAPAKYAGVLTAVWLAASAVGGVVAGQYGRLWGVLTPRTYFLGMSLALAVVAGVFYIRRAAVQKIIDHVRQRA